MLNIQYAEKEDGHDAPMETVNENVNLGAMNNGDTLYVNIVLIVSRTFNCNPQILKLYQFSHRFLIFVSR